MGAVMAQGWQWPIVKVSETSRPGVAPTGGGV